MRFKNLYFLLTLMIISSGSQAQPVLKWAGSLGSPAGIKPTAMTVSSRGEVITAGNFYSTNDFNPGTGVSNLNPANGTTFLTKLDSNGNLVWARQLGFYNATDTVFISDMHIDTSGYIYVTGSYVGDADLDPSGGQYLIVSQIGTAREAFISKLAPNGNLLWAVNFYGGNTSMGTAVRVDNQDGVYVAGYFSGNVTIPSVGTISSSSQDIFVAKLDTVGTFSWVKTSAGTAMAFGLAIDDSLNVYTSGTFSGTTDFSPNITGGSLTSSANRDAFVAKYDKNGTLIWTNQLGGTGNEEAHSIVTDKTGHIVVGGGYSASIDCDPSSGTYILGAPQGCYGYFLTKHTDSGTFVWAVSPASSGTCNPRLPVSLDTFGNIYVASDFGDTIDFDPGSGVYNLSPNGPRIVSGQPVLNPDIFVSRINADGSFGWARRFGSSYANERAEAIAVDVQGNVHVTGTYTDTVDFDPGSNVWNLTTSTISSVPRAGAYVQKLWQCPGIIDSINAAACGSYTLGSNTYSMSGLYTTTFSTAEGCDSIIKLDLTINTIDTGITQGIGSLTSKETAAAYQWISCFNRLNPVIQGATSASYTTSITGSYAVIVTKNGCSDTSSCHFLIGTNVPETAFGDNISLYPNPTTDRVAVSFGNLQQKVEIEISNVAGQIMERKTVTNAASSELQVEGPAGVYIIKLTSDSGRTAYLKLVKQ